MQQADYADSTASAAASGGKFDEKTGSKLTYILPFPISELHNPSDDLAIVLEGVDTLLTCISEMVDDATIGMEKHGALAAWPVERFRHLGSIVMLAQAEVARGQRHHKAMETVVAEHIDRRAA